MTEEQIRCAAARLEAKRAAVLRPKRSKMRLLVPLAAGALVVGVAATLVARPFSASEEKPASGAMFGFVPQQGEVTYPLADLDGGTARFYQFKAGGGVIVRYFLHRSADGTLTAALDACADCWREAKGHRQEGDEVVCVHCEKRFPIADLGAAADPCVPLALPVSAQADRVAVAIPDLAAAAKYFQSPYGSL